MLISQNYVGCCNINHHKPGGPQSGLVIEDICSPITDSQVNREQQQHQPGLAWRPHVMIDQHVGETSEHDHHHHQHHDQPQHGEGDHLEDAVVLRVPVLGQDGNLKYGKD